MPNSENQQPDVPLHGYIPSHVRHADISTGAKLLYSEISGMTIKKGYCYATNGYLAEIYGVSKRTIQNWVSELRDAKIVSTSYDEDREIHKRRIYLEGYDPPKS